MNDHTPQAIGLLNPPDRMNKTERRYATEVLDMLLAAGDIVRYDYEALTFRLADKTRYTPDFFVLRSDGAIEFVEVKGFWRDDARVKLKTVAEMFPMFRFYAVEALSKKKGGGWSVERIAPWKAVKGGE